ncbi:MAG TPA: nuclear transport factor 2 family protein [Myxococcales bacterium]|nr:nuclear transport factor 2 family protein [Myxococcales bacterium]HIK86498.1 nuclear transport factor 2 family protein [Myxococcales bacterium]
MNDASLDEILAEDVVFHSPVVHTPQEGRALTKLYLMAAFNVLPGSLDSESSAQDTIGQSADESKKSKGIFGYVREVVGDNDVVLEFRTEIDGISINGIDMIHFNDDGKIDDFKVMVRPLKAIQKLHEQMAAMLENMKKSG